MTEKQPQADSKKEEMVLIQEKPERDEDFYGAIKSDSCKADISEEDLAKWAPLLVPFKHWVPVVRADDGPKVIELTPNKFETFDRSKKYDMSPKLLIGEPHRDMFDAYLWEFKEKELKDRDSIDQLLLASPLKFEKRVFYILHSYGGYWQFFRPSFDEIAATLQEAGVDPNQYHRIYSTSVGWSTNAGTSYSTKYDKNRGITTVYMLPKTVDLSKLDKSDDVVKNSKDGTSTVDVLSKGTTVSMTRAFPPGGITFS